jgi:hypothetical protein
MRFSALFSRNVSTFLLQSSEKSHAHPPSETAASVSGSAGAARAPRIPRFTSSNAFP